MFKKAVSVLCPLAASDEKVEKNFVQSVLEHPDHSLDELRECLEIRDGDVIETIPSILEAEKRRCQRRAFES